MSGVNKRYWFDLFKEVTHSAATERQPYSIASVMDFYRNSFGLSSFTSLVRKSVCKDFMRIFLYVTRWPPSKRRSWKGFWRPKKVHWMMEGLLLTKAGCCGSKAASRICKTKSTHNQTIRYHFHHIFVTHTHTWFCISTHIIENPLHVLPDVPNWEFTVHCRAETE